MKKLTAILLCACLLISLLAGCSARIGNEKPISGTKPAQTEPAKGGDDAPAPTQPPKQDTPAETPKTEGVSVEETVLYDEGGIRVTVKSLDMDGFLGPEFKLLVENDTDHNITLTDNGLIVNGITITTGMYINVAAGKKANDTLTLLSSALETADITQIATVKCSAHVYDSDSYDDIVDFWFTINTSIADTYVQQIDESGDVIMDQDGVTVIAKSLNDSLFGNAVVLLVKNDTGKDILLDADNISVNGFMVNAWLYDTIYADTVAFCELEISRTDLEDNDIERIDEITFTLEVSDRETYRTISVSDEIGIYVNW